MIYLRIRISMMNYEEKIGILFLEYKDTMRIYSSENVLFSCMYSPYLWDDKTDRMT
jgi:hypothetical protein